MRIPATLGAMRDELSDETGTEAVPLEVLGSDVVLRMNEEELIKKLRALYAGEENLLEICRALGVSMYRLYYLLGKANLPLRVKRGPTSRGVTRVYKTNKGYLLLPCSSLVIRKLGLKPGNRVRWEVRQGKIIGTPERE